MRFSLLGPLVVTDGTSDVKMPAGSRLRVLLAALLLHANVPIPAGALAEIVWDGSPPPAAVDTLRSYIRRLRKALGRDATTRIAARGAGYLIRVDEPELDTLEFAARCQDTRAALRAGEWQDSSVAAAQALGLWRAVPLLDVPSETLRAKFVPQFERLRLQVLEDSFDAGLRLGRYQELTPQLLDAAAEHPLQERFHVQLMLALASTGRRAQALQAYQAARRVLVDELGIEPGPELRDIHQQILAGDRPGTGGQANGTVPGEVARASAAGALTEGTAPLAQPAGSPPDPAQLPADIADFTGREAQVSYVCDALTRDEADGDRETARIVLVSGAAGLGKTALAVHAAHQLRDQFPDGQLWADLRGASAHPAAPAEVLARFLRDLGVDRDRIPAGEEERAVRYRTRLAGRRMLIMLDNAKDAAQVRPLLPGAASCAVVVTTRNRALYVLSTRFVDLDTLPEPEALELFARIVGSNRLAAEPEASAEVLAACAGQPLAIRICAARLATRRRWPIAMMAGRLRDERRRLDELQVGDLDVRASFRVSYSTLPAAGSGSIPRAFRVLGCWQGQTITLPAAAALTGEREADTAVALEALVDASLLESPAPNRYQFHDLLHLFAAEQMRAEETDQARLGAVTRLLEWYARMTEAVADVISPHRYRIPPCAPPVPNLLPDSAEDALAWYDSEQANVMAAIRQAAAAGLHDVAWRLPVTLFPLFNRRHNWTDCVIAHRIAVNSARAAGHRRAEAWALQNLGAGLEHLGDMNAFPCLEEALAIRQEIRDQVGEAQTAISLVEAYYKLRGPAAAFDYWPRCLESVRQAGNPALLGVALNNHGMYCLTLGRLDEAAESLQEALSTFTAIGSYVQGHVVENLGRIHLQSGRLSEAIATLTEAHRLHVASGDLMGKATALKYLGEAQRGVGQENQARESLTAALTLFENLRNEAEAAVVLGMLTARDNVEGTTVPGPR